MLLGESSCKTKVTHSVQNPSSSFALLSAEDVNLEPQISTLRLDDADFRVNAVRVGEQEFLQYNTPIVSYQIPKIADYVEILRCPSSTIIMGGQNTLEQVEREVVTLEQETAIFQANNFWSMALQSAGCIVIASNYSELYFFDSFAPSGDFFYYVRACVEPQRLTGRQISSANCSRQVTRSVEHKHVNKRDRLQMLALHQAADYRMRMHKIGREIIQKTRLLGTALKGCQDKAQRPIISSQQKDGLKSIIALSAGIGGGLGAIGGGVVGRLKKKSILQSSFVGAVGGLFVGYLVGAVVKATNPTLRGYPDDSPKCYTRTSDEVERTIQDYMVERGSTGSGDDFKICSCADAESLQGEVKNLQREIEDLVDIERKTLANYGLKEENTKLPSFESGDTPRGDSQPSPDNQ